MMLETLLYQTFGFPAFRANQEAVCRAATDGRDVLLVMPTGAGKSLCYQLPAIARGGTALVISPLIALMDDQAAKLSALGLRVARIHSGLSREAAREACRDYLNGTLQFLFVAPERMRVPGFPEMLAKKKPALIAIDEAHCISAWGHDFRPDYRTLGEHLPMLRPAPIIALTATATPAVQRDIVTQLQLGNPALFIHGFRRDNLHIEVLEMSKPRRNEFVTTLLAKPENRPAIVYAPSRKSAEELAGLLGAKAAAYHAGLDSGLRERVQSGFQSGKVDIVVATIAFGMGIDKADVRTVVHIALPASVEAYYQEIGRAGRDGQPSRTILLHSFADRKMHDFFLERDYPAATELSRVAAALTPDYSMPDLLRQRLKMDAATFDKAAEKLAAQGAAAFDIEGNVRATGSNTWRSGYDAQLAFRRSQIDRMVAFAETSQCRMAALIQHFGDTADGLKPCGHCDFCNPTGTSGSTFRTPSTEDLRHFTSILRTLDGQGRSTGKLYTELAAGALRGTPAAKDRSAFDPLLDALVRAGLISITSEQWTNPEGNLVTFKKAALTHEGREAAATGTLHTPDLLLRDTAAATPKNRNRKASGSNASGSSPRTRRASENDAAVIYTPAQQTLETSLRTWRKAEAARSGKPAFIVFGDSVLQNLVVAAPQTLSELLTVSGIGPEKADRYGADLIAICRETQVPIVDRELRPAMTPKAPLMRDKTRRVSRVQQTMQNLKTAAEDIKPLSMSTSAGRRRSREYGESVYRRLDLEDDLRAFADAQAVLLRQAPSILLSEEAVAEILRFRPKTLVEVERLRSVRNDLPLSFLKGLLNVCLDEYKPQGAPLKQPEIRPNAVDSVFVRKSTGPYIRHGSRPNLTALTPTQQALDTRLRDWRKSESEKLGLPQFFVLSSSTLRSIVLTPPTTISQLRTLPGIDLEKLDRFGPAILSLCAL